MECSAGREVGDGGCQRAGADKGVAGGDELVGSDGELPDDLDFTCSNGRAGADDAPGVAPGEHEEMAECGWWSATGAHAGSGGTARGAQGASANAAALQRARSSRMSGDMTTPRGARKAAADDWLRDLDCERAEASTGPAQVI